MAMSSKLTAALLVLPLLAACEGIDPVSESADPGFGEAVKYNAAIQTVNPDPVYDASDAVPGQNGQRGADATKRDRSGQVKEVERDGTGSASGGGPR
jgi:hypothetical protein